jgi:hypothetical protein
MSTERHWTEDAPVRLASSRVNRVYIAGPMTGLPEFNFPTFNAEAAKLREAGMTVLNPAEYGIVEGADWADYLRHDIAGLASCESIYLLPGWSKSKGVRLERTIADALGMLINFHPEAERDAQTPPQGAIRPLDSAALEHTINMMPWRDVAPLKLRQFGTQLWAQFCSVPADDGAWHWTYSSHLQTRTVTTPSGENHEIRDSEMPHPRLAKLFDVMLAALVQKRASAADVLYAGYYRELHKGNKWPAIFANINGPEPITGAALDAAMAERCKGGIQQ